MRFSIPSVVAVAAIFALSVQAKISRPSKDECWAAGQMQTVKWDTSDMKGSMKMHLCKGGAKDISESILVISELVENTGSYNWMPDKSIKSLSSFTIIIVEIDAESSKYVSDDFYISGLSDSSGYNDSNDYSKDCKSYDSGHNDNSHEYKTRTRSDSHHEYKTHTRSYKTHESKTHESKTYEYKTHEDKTHEYKTHAKSDNYHDYKTYTRSEKEMATTVSSVAAEQTYSAYILTSTSTSIETAPAYSVETASIMVYSTLSTSTESYATTETAEATYTTPVAESQPTDSTLTTEVAAATYSAPPPPYPTSSSLNYTYAVVGTGSPASTSAAVVVFTGAASSVRANVGIVASVGAAGLLLFFL